MKRIISLVLVATMVFSSSVLSFAKDNRNSSSNGKNSRNGYFSTENRMQTVNTAKGKNTKNDDKAKMLYDMGLFHGRSVKTYKPDLEDGANRAEALMLIGKALGWVVDPNVKSIPGYNDVPEWAAPYVKYAIDNNITKGIGHNKFGSYQSVNSRMIYSWYARALLYSEDVWKNPTLLADLGMITADQAQKIAALDDPATRDLIVGILFDSLKWKMKGSNMRLIQRLVNNLWVNRDVAEDSGLLDPDKVIMSYTMKALSQKTVQLTFSHSLDSATVTTGSLEVKLNDTATSAFSINASGKNLYVYFSNIVPANTIVSVKPLTSVKSVSGLMTDGKAKTLTMAADTTVPVVSDVKALSASKLQFTFSEPVATTVADTAGHIFIDNVLAAGSFSFSESATVLTLDLTTPLAQGTRTVLVTAGLQDDGGLFSSAYSKQLSIAFDKQAPAVIEVSVLDRTHLNIKFNEAVKPGIGSLMVVNESFSTPAVLLLDGKVAQLTLSNPLPTDADTRQVLLTYKSIEDLYGNKDSDNQYFRFTAPDDATAPTAVVTNVSAAALYAIEIIFNEPVDGFTADDFVLAGKNSQNDSFTPAVSGIVFDSSARKATITLLPASMPEGNSTVNLTLKNTILDLSVNQYPMVETTSVLHFSKDTAGPVATVTTTAGLIILVTFNEPVDGFTTADFTLTEADSSAVTVNTVTLNALATSAEIAISADGLTVGENVLTLGLKNTIKDLAVPANELIPATHVVRLVKP